MNHDLIRLASETRQCHEQGQPWRLPLMTVRQMGIFMRLLEPAGTHASGPQPQ